MDARRFQLIPAHEPDSHHLTFFINGYNDRDCPGT